MPTSLGWTHEACWSSIGGGFWLFFWDPDLRPLTQGVWDLLQGVGPFREWTIFAQILGPPQGPLTCRTDRGSTVSPSSCSVVPHFPNFPDVLPTMPHPRSREWTMVHLGTPWFESLKLNFQERTYDCQSTARGWTYDPWVALLLATSASF
uniref:Uncharacterized protein n=1 Tax=Solanum tuberosum TaxID=4113 RepID=M1DYQ7_SOLTU